MDKLDNLMNNYDIRTPLSIILGYASDIEEIPSLSENTRKQAAIIRWQGEKQKTSQLTWIQPCLSARIKHIDKVAEATQSKIKLEAL